MLYVHSVCCVRCNWVIYAQCMHGAILVYVVFVWLYVVCGKYLWNFVWNMSFVCVECVLYVCVLYVCVCVCGIYGVCGICMVRLVHVRYVCVIYV